MITENNKCSYCNYNSNRLYNFKRHMMTKHKEINDYIIINDDKKMVNDEINMVNDDKKMVNDKQCYKCNKIL